MEHTQLFADVERLAKTLGQLPAPDVGPAFVAVSGFLSTGKPYFCRQLAKRLPFAILENDSLRKVLFSPPTYSSTESLRLFQIIFGFIGRLQKIRLLFAPNLEFTGG
jgi:hypothetical protein